MIAVRNAVSVVHIATRPNASADVLTSLIYAVWLCIAHPRPTRRAKHRELLIANTGRSTKTNITKERESEEVAHNYFCPACGATLDPGEKCTCPGYIIRTWPNHKNEKAPSAATEEAVGANAPAEKATKSISQPKTKSNIKNY